MTSSIPPNDLPEKDFISEGYSKNPFPLWIWGTILSLVVCVMWGTGSWYTQKMTQQVTSSPFLQVTNREISLFLWQFPEYMRINTKNKTGYLEGFQYREKVTMELEAADKYAMAPPEILFLYHTWKRLISREIPQRAIPVSEFREFLAYAEEWNPQYWSAAPPGYVKLVESLPGLAGEDMQMVSGATLPQEVRIAFQGWRNFFKDREKINQLRPRYSEMQDFLSVFPHYARSYWRNIVDKGDVHYLRTLTLGKFTPQGEIPNYEMMPFLKVAFYNYYNNKQANATQPTPSLEIGPRLQ